MVMDNDAQKVIAISLGKIATSRCQRGGPSLHRSLLVASVLYKARTTYVDDVFPTFGHCPDPCVEDNANDGDESVEGAASEARLSGTVTSTSPLTSAYDDCDSTDELSSGDDKENVQPSNERLSPEPPVRCTKRRRTVDDEDCAKRCKRDTALWRRSSSLCSTDSDAESSDSELLADGEPHDADGAMEVESISNLVLAFNSGLKGLSWDAEDATLDDHGLAPLRRGVSLPDLCHRTPSFPVAVLAV